MRIPKPRPEVMAVGEAELVRLTRELEERHRQSLPGVQAAVAEWAETKAFETKAPEARARLVSRRGFLGGSGLLVAGGVALAACGGSSSATSPTAKGASGPGPSAGADLDVSVGATAASLENLAVFAYRAGIRAARAGRLGTVPPAVVSFAATAMAQHQDHAAAWNAMVTAAGYQKVTMVDPSVAPIVQAGFAHVHDVASLARLALQLEDVAAATYLEGIGVLVSPQALGTAAAIQPVEMQHVAILNFVLGQYPAPDAFAPTAGARPPGDYRAEKA